MVYLLNSPILTAYGTWRFTGPIALGAAKSLLNQGFVSAIGHETSARFLYGIIGMEIPANRVSAVLQPGDIALVLRILQRLPEGVLLDEQSLAGIPWELSLLERLE